MSTHLTRILRNVFVSLTLSATGSQMVAQNAMDPDVAAALLRLSLAAAPAAPANVTVTPGRKKEGTKRIGVMTPNSDMNSSDGAESIRELEKQFLSGPTVEVVRLSARLPIQAYAEAKAMDCDYVLTSAVSQKKAKSGFGALKTLSAVAPMASMIPGAGMAAAMTTMATTQSLAAASSLAASNIKARAEISFDYSLHGLDGSTVLADSHKAKAKCDGDDVLTSMVQQAASQIVGLVAK